MEALRTQHRRIAGVLLIAIVLGTVADGQNAPNFSGEWRLDLASSQLHEDFSVLERGVAQIDHREPAFSFRRTFVIKGKPNDTSYDVSTDGREWRTERPGGGVTVATMRWDQTALVLTQRITVPGAGEWLNSVRYELAEQGRTLRATEDFNGAGRSHHNIWIFRRQ
jgi:hypothetical protein